MSLHAVILAGGYGSRLLPFTAQRPKHLLPIGDEPVIAHQLHRLAQAGVSRVVMATAYHADAFRPALGDGRAFGLDLAYSREDAPLGTGGALRQASETLQPDDADDVLVLNGDLLSEHDLAAQMRVHRASRDGGCALTVHARDVDDARAFGLLTLDGDRVVRFEEKPHEPVAGAVNAGTYVMTGATTRALPLGVEASLERDLFPRMAEHGHVRVYREDSPFADIGTPEALLAANRAWAARHGRDAVVLSAHVSPAADVRGSLVMADAVLAQCRVTDSIVGPGARIGAGAELDGCVIGDDVVIAPGTALTGVTLAVDPDTRDRQA